MLTIIGLMSGTSADGIDAVLVRSDGRCECSPLATHFVPYQDSTRHQIVQARTHPETYLADSNRCYALTQAQELVPALRLELEPQCGFQ